MLELMLITLALLGQPSDAAATTPSAEALLELLESLPGDWDEEAGILRGIMTGNPEA